MKHPDSQFKFEEETRKLVFAEKMQLTTVNSSVVEGLVKVSGESMEK